MHSPVLEPLSLPRPALPANQATLSWHPFKVDSCATTQQLVRQQLEEHGEQAQHGTLIVADSQEQGLGRRGAHWFSSVDNLEFSFLLKVNAPGEKLPFINLFVSHVLLGVLYQDYKIMGWVKWPNDILVAGRKICGVMSESRLLAEGQQAAVIIGCGLNVNCERQAFPPELRAIATSMRQESGERYDLWQVLAAFMGAFAQRYSALEKAIAPASSH